MIFYVFLSNNALILSYCWQKGIRKLEDIHPSCKICPNHWNTVSCGLTSHNVWFLFCVSESLRYLAFGGLPQCILNIKILPHSSFVFSLTGKFYWKKKRRDYMHIAVEEQKKTKANVIRLLYLTHPNIEHEHNQLEYRSIRETSPSTLWQPISHITFRLNSMFKIT